MLYRFLSSLVLLSLLTACSPRLAEVAEPDGLRALTAYRYSCEPIDSLVVAAHLPALEEAYGKHLTCPEDYRDKLLAALSFYPELRDVRLEVISRRLKTSMAARPTGYAFVRGRRRYRIFVDDLTEKVHDFRLADYSAQVGIFIHELGHVMHYRTRSNAQLIADGSRYLTSEKFRHEYEVIADGYGFDHGGGYYLHLISAFIMGADLTPEYRAYKEANYRSPGELLDVHHRHVRRAGREYSRSCVLNERAARKREKAAKKEIRDER